ncbi:hypothetical protein HNR46_000426 [Haloferula luteola]|uniref:F5/8 type C domain-containing protein n=1 Tax=Haloferula luteola TaxID=595692 RepID=A0A840UWP6_9BACT|nr:hypothetical protein [Haloferula luteola]MBB5350202.1 hypothetical protein [Haloferula luteola]
MKPILRPSRLLAVSCLLVVSSPLRAEVLFSDDLDDPNGTELPGKLPDVGLAWSQNDGSVLTVQDGAIDTRGAARLIFADFADTFDGAERVLKLTVDFTFLSDNDGYAGVSLYDGDQELIFLGELAGQHDSIGMEGAPVLERAVASMPLTPGIVTLTYDYDTGRTRLYAGDDLTEPPVAAAQYTAGLEFDRIRIANGNNGDVAVGSLVVETLPKGPPSVELFTADRIISRQGEEPVIDWETSFADEITITPGVETGNASFGSTPVALAVGDTELTITAGDSESGVTATSTLVLRSVVGGEMNFRYVRFTPVTTRDAAADFVQLSEFEFYDELGFLVVPVAVTNPGGVNPVPEEGPESLLDGDPTTKWVDDAKAPVVFDFGSVAPGVTEYAMGTAGNLPGWDPVRYYMEGSADGESWTLIENMTAFDLPVPTNRQSYTDFIPFPGESVIPLPVAFELVDWSVDRLLEEVTLSWQGGVGQSYRITASEDLLDWSEVLESGIPGEVGLTTKTVPFEGSEQRFFRVEEE